MGTSTDDQPTPPATGTPPAPTPPPVSDPTVVDPPEDDAPLGENGQKALDIWKERAKAAEKEAKRARDLEAENAQLKAAQMSDQDRALAEARREAADQARAEVQGATYGRLFTSELKAAVAGKLLPAAAADLLVDTAVALKLLDLDEIPVTDTGDIDGEAISQAVDTYVTSRPHLAASATPTLPGPIDQGTRPPAGGGKTIAEQIREAEAAGDWKRAGALKVSTM